MTRAEVARKLFKEGYACSQAVSMAFSDVVNINKEVLSKISLPFGGGLGRLRLTCGAVSGMAMILGLVFTDATNEKESKLKVYEITRELVSRFEKQYGSIICKELLEGSNLKVEVAGKPEERTNEYYQKRPCDELVYNAAKILEEYLIEKGII